MWVIEQNTKVFKLLASSYTLLMVMKEKIIPEEFIQRIFRERVSTIHRMIRKELSDKELYVEFLRHTPIVATNGLAGANAAVKGAGFVVKKDLLHEALNNLRKIIANKPLREDALKFLLENLYVEEKLDFKKLSSLELAKRHTYKT